jgi:2-keto-4-pentenoate hydratase/2-oxohepta-3-ene-1,7-dioic acid hydratase in catechol pathway
MRFANVAGRAAIIVEDRAVDVQRASGGRIGSDPRVYLDLANHDKLAEVAQSADPGAWPELDPATLGPPVPRPRKGFGVGLNYRSHALETGREIPTDPHFFAKTENCVSGPFDDIVVPFGLDQVDFEAELVIVFGRACKGATPEDAWSHLAGVTCGQDVSDRAEQRRPPLRQFTVAKSYDTFGPIGPVLVTPDDLPDRDALGLTCTVSGEVMQRGNTDDLIFDVASLVAWLSRYITFGCGDLVWTGTPSGVGDAREPPRYLRHGDVVETTIDGIGTMRNRVVSG